MPNPEQTAPPAACHSIVARRRQPASIAASGQLELDKNLVLRLLNEAIDCLFYLDGYLIDAGVSERSLTHRLAIHVETKFARHFGEQFADYAVDCEFNRDGFHPKRLPLERIESPSDSIEAITVFPDIVIHKRGKDGPNILALEIKKSHSEDEGNRDYDKRKLQGYRKVYKYQHTVYLCIGPERAKAVPFFVQPKTRSIPAYSARQEESLST